jgi:hypothetical protein
MPSLRVDPTTRRLAMSLAADADADVRTVLSLLDGEQPKRWSPARARVLAAMAARGLIPDAATMKVAETIK